MMEVLTTPEALLMTLMAGITTFAVMMMITLLVIRNSVRNKEFLKMEIMDMIDTTIKEKETELNNSTSTWKKQNVTKS